MSQIHANPDEIELFANSLAQFEAHVREELVRIQNAYALMQETWADECQQKYNQHFDEVIPMISRLLEETPEHVCYLQNKVEQLRAFLNR
jgi:uncharacterized protein YukE